MRLFVGLELPSAIADAVLATIERLRPAAPKLRWSPHENLHITTKFIGAWPDHRLDELKRALAAIRVHHFEVQLSGLGWFPNPHSPRIFWAAALGGPPLSSLAAKTDEATAALGVPGESKSYTPHLTLARVTPGVDLRDLRTAVASLPKTGWGSFRAEAFYLYSSDAGPAGSVYTKLARFPIGN